MKKLQLQGLMLLTVLAFAACRNSGFKTTSSGLKYRIYEGSSKDSTKTGAILKMNQSVRLSGSKDTLLEDTYSRIPFYAQVQDIKQLPGQPFYAPDEIYKFLKKGDSAVVILYVDSLIKKGIAQEAQLPPFMKKGDQLTFTLKVLDVFQSDSLARLDYQKEGEAFQKRMEQKEREDSIAFEKSGGRQKQLSEMEAYLKKKNITATKTALGTFVKIDQPGTGKQAADGKFVTLRYTGKKVEGDAVFIGPDSFTAQVGTDGSSIPGFDDGVKQFKEGGKGVIYIPGFLAYGKNPPPGSPFKEYEPLYFEVEIMRVADTPPQQAPQATAQPAVPDAAKDSKK
ncbi:peptidylprolyl isomerase [Niabella ginsenosidivorans]|uniref:peptidylprolyl isomerase n=1 Tax=Niabella ginsenosidivorans TaxID=1176587 RepID=A0A1A9I469_9BACT|nr:FKBP-type peptidyl-prolyl cis-trans isomerase [Niabella ginsenosidivorans]ANH81364.1 peptidylprolyl isomerase [Niabella ginsenosidivorans]